MNNPKFPYEDVILKLKDREEEVIWLQDKAYIIKPATEDEIERIGHGHFCMKGSR